MTNVQHQNPVIDNPIVIRPPKGVNWKKTGGSLKHAKGNLKKALDFVVQRKRYDD